MKRDLLIPIAERNLKSLPSKRERKALVKA